MLSDGFPLSPWVLFTIPVHLFSFYPSPVIRLLRDGESSIHSFFFFIPTYFAPLKSLGVRSPRSNPIPSFVCFVAASLDLLQSTVQGCDPLINLSVPSRQFSDNSPRNISIPPESRRGQPLEPLEPPPWHHRLFPTALAKTPKH